MILTVTTLTGQMFPMDVAEDLELENFKAICEAESGFPAEEIVLLVNIIIKHDHIIKVQISMNHIIKCFYSGNKSLDGSNIHEPKF